MLFEKIKRRVREQRLEENARAATEKNEALIEYLYVANDIEMPGADENEEGVAEDE